MIDRDAEQSYESEDHMASTISRTRPAYDALLATLSKLGTEVARDRVLEIDNIAPYGFVRKGRVEYVFPPQPWAEAMSNEDELITRALGKLVTEKGTRKIDKSFVKGRLTVDYDDADKSAAMSVVDVYGESTFPVEVSTALDEAFAVYEPVKSPL